MNLQINNFFEQESWLAYLIASLVSILLGLRLHWLIYTFLKLNIKRMPKILNEQLNDKPFVNWTFNSQKLMGSIFLYVDYTFPVTELRTKLSAVLKDYPLWDKNVSNLLVTNIDGNF